jgi:hypothetical protein
LAAPQARRSNPELVGRPDELEALEDEPSRAMAGEFRLVLRRPFAMRASASAMELPRA